jgi:hypothetical protein
VKLTGLGDSTDVVATGTKYLRPVLRGLWAKSFPLTVFFSTWSGILYAWYGSTRSVIIHVY